MEHHSLMLSILHPLPLRFVSELRDPKIATRESPVALTITPLRIVHSLHRLFMLPSINLDHQSFFQTDKIDNESTQRLLPTKLISRKLT